MAYQYGEYHPLGPYFEITNCYYMGESYKMSGDDYGDAEKRLVNCRTITEAEAKLQATFQGFDFATVWQMGDGADYEYPTLRTFTSPVIIPGDVNDDGNVDARDILQLRRSFVGSAALDERATLAADVNGDGVTDARDALKLRRFFAGIIDSL